MPINPAEVKWDDAPIDRSKIKWNDSKQQTPARSWTGVTEEAISNIPSSAADFASGIYQAVRHPIETGKAVIDMGAGALQNAAPDWVKTGINAIEGEGGGRFPSQPAQRAAETASAVGNLYKNRYGGMENLKETIATDPVGVAADLSTVLTGGAALAPKGGQVANVLQRGANVTNPLSVIPAGLKFTGRAIKNTLGPTTGVGSEAISEAAKAGYSLSKTGKPNTFWENLSGKAPMTDVIDEVKRGVYVLGKQKSESYRSNMANIKGDKTVLAFDKIDDSLRNAQDISTYKGQIKNVRAAEVVKRISDTVDEWRQLPAKEFHTPEGLDALKQKIGGIVESIPFEEKTARTAANGVYHAVKNEITRQAPTYAKTMKEYSEATDMIREIERALSAGEKASADTTLRKLQSLMRNNVNTNYGNRLDLARDLQAKSGVDFMPSIAGQALNSWTSRGLAGRMENLGTLGAAAALQNPSLLGLLPFQSPKLVGGIAYAGGRASGIPAGLLSDIGLTPQMAKTGGLLAGEVGKPILDSENKQSKKRNKQN